MAAVGNLNGRLHEGPPTFQGGGFSLVRSDSRAEAASTLDFRPLIRHLARVNPGMISGASRTIHPIGSRLGYSTIPGLPI